MTNWTKILTRPYVILGAGALLGAIAVASFKSEGFKPIKLNYAPRQTTVANVPKPSDGTELGSLNDQYVKLGEYVSNAVVHVSQFVKVAGGRAERNVGDGSGFIYSSDGWIVTNDHVVAGSKEVNVVLADGREFKGKVLQTGERDLDIAVVKIDASDLPTLKMTDSDAVRPGQIVVAAGAPFGLENTITFGHVSAISREGVAGDGYTPQRMYRGMIQTDASINPGNSGGPLVDINGDVIGVNTSIYSTSGASAGIGFAFPSNMTKVIADELIKTGKFDRGMLGILPRDLKPFEAKKIGITGAYVENVPEDVPAGAAGIRAGDVITEIAGRQITNETDLRVVMYEHSPDDVVDVTFVRNGKATTKQIKLMAPPPQQPAPQMRQFQRGESPFGEGVPPELRDFFRGPEAERPTLGVSLYDIDDTTREQYGLPVGLTGAIVESVRPDSIAAKAGLKEGDVITKVNGKEVATGEDVVNALGKAEVGSKVMIKFVRMTDGRAFEKTAEVVLK